MDKNHARDHPFVTTSSLVKETTGGIEVFFNGPFHGFFQTCPPPPLHSRLVNVCRSFDGLLTSVNFRNSLELYLRSLKT